MRFPALVSVRIWRETKDVGEAGSRSLSFSRKCVIFSPSRPFKQIPGNTVQSASHPGCQGALPRKMWNSQLHRLAQNHNGTDYGFSHRVCGRCNVYGSKNDTWSGYDWKHKQEVAWFCWSHAFAVLLNMHVSVCICVYAMQMPVTPVQPKSMQ